MSESKILLGASDGDNVYLDLNELLTSGMFIQGNSGSGKSGLIRRVLEETFGQVQQIILDAEGDYSTLRAGFDYAPVTAHVETAESLALKVYEAKVTVIVDMSDLDLPAQQEYVRLFVGAQMLHARRLKPEQRHHALVVLDELQLFAPEQSKAESTPVMVDLGHRGRRLGLHPILATQRLSSVKKDAVSEIPNKLFGRTALDVDQQRVGQELGFDRAAQRRLADLKTREFWAFGPALTTTPVLFTVADVATPMPRIGELASVKLPELTPEVLASLAALEAVEPVEVLPESEGVTSAGRGSAVRNERTTESTTFLVVRDDELIANLEYSNRALVDDVNRLEATVQNLEDELRRSEMARRLIEANLEAWAHGLQTTSLSMLNNKREAAAIIDGSTVLNAGVSVERNTRTDGLPEIDLDAMRQPAMRVESRRHAPQLQERADGPVLPEARQQRIATTEAPRRERDATRKAGRDTEDMKDEEVAALVRAEVAQQLRDTSRVLVVPPAEVIRQDYLQKAIDCYLADVKQLSADAQELYRFLASRGTFLSISQVSAVLSGYVSGLSNGKWSPAAKELLGAGMVAKGGSGGNGFKASTDEARSRVVKALEPHLATDAEIEQVYQAVLGRIAGEVVT